MKTYKVKIAWEGVNVGDIFKKIPGGAEHGNEDGITVYQLSDPLLAVFLHLGFIEEVGVVKEKFVPKEGELYWYLSDRATCYSCTNLYDAVDQRRISIGNSYRTESDCAEARERVLKAY